MKSSSLLVLACLVSMPVFAQGLPDEINYGPYETRFRSLEKEAEAASAQLNQSRSSLAEAQRFIREETAHIQDLQNEISQAQSEIYRLRQEIPSLEAQISNLRSEDARVQMDLRSKQSEESNLNSRLMDAQRDLRPLEELLARKQQRIRELERDVSQYSGIEREASQRLARTQNEAQRLESQANDLRNQIRQLQSELSSIDSRISSLQSQISSAESNVSTLNSNLSSERAKLNALNGRVSEYESEVSRLRSSGAPADQIAQAERKLSAARSTRDNTASEIRSLESRVSQAESQVRSLRSQIDDLRRSQSTLPSRISSLESRARQLDSERMQTQNEINRYGAELQTARRNLEMRQSQLLSARTDIRNDEQNVMRQRQFIENLSRQLDSVRSEISSLLSRSRNLNSQIARATDNIRENQSRIPQLEQNVRSNQSEIAEGERDLARARQDERTFTQSVARDEAKLSDAVNRREAAKSEWTNRLSLYNRYLNEAQVLGEGQSASGTQLGNKEGGRLSQELSKLNGISVGQELGAAEARHWGSVRGEIQGYDLGYREGLSSSEDITRATQDASGKAAQDAELYAQVNFKPVFFEEFVQEEFKKPLKSSLKSMNSLHAMKLSFEASLDTVAPLSPNEIARSEELKTPLDAAISLAAQDVKTISQKAKRLSDPEVAFKAPSNIPYGTPACTQVYKNLAVFKAACEGAYKGSFAQNYVEGAHAAFAELYTPQFRDAFDASNVAKREADYAHNLSTATAVGRAEGLRIGKIEIYQSTYASVYQSSYKSELEKARVKAKLDASNELKAFLKAKPLLTTASSALFAENFRGGEEILVTGKVKNVASVPLNGAVLFRITEVINGEKVDGEAVLNSAGALSVTDLPSLKVKISDSARAGEKVIVKGVLELPGDLYKGSRKEPFELTQILAANPAHSFELDYNKTPSIKGVFRRNIHFMTVTVAPKLEDIKDGYTVSVMPIGEAASLMDVRISSGTTGALATGASKDIRLSYVFNDQAKGKTISLEVTVSYLGKVIRKEIATLVPR